MTIKIKVCGMTNIKETNKLAKLNIDHIGFINIRRSKRYITIDEINNLQKHINDKGLSTLVLEPKNAYEVITSISNTQISNIQLHSLNNFDIRYIKWLNQYNMRYVNTTKVIGLQNTLNANKMMELKKYALYSDNILLDYIKGGLTGGTNTQIPIETAIKASQIIKKENGNTEVTLAGGLNLEYLESIQDKLHYFNRIDLNSGVENTPGRKNIQKIKKIVKLVNET
ncbi:phosphoribosylanthranilate isomerase [Methanosphaera sp. ISO3-F5]|uniref:phosphoribosylanthranilate isomerase n=1 Tax=Methanosphaera sp. ISO3-F5 TaxID=1452353 RepID=UPI002B2625C5|nr:phosphoribosylanthranilate isomerase [Methanosphaera sp. ISO3-F5]WQH64641.1 phosphoribosylanthranilate isomerase [Methanosphaera sp. ISO3-F5]